MITSKPCNAVITFFIFTLFGQIRDEMIFTINFINFFCPEVGRSVIFIPVWPIEDFELVTSGKQYLFE